MIVTGESMTPIHQIVSSGTRPGLASCGKEISQSENVASAWPIDESSLAKNVRAA